MKTPLPVLPYCIGECCSRDYPTVLANLADRKIWNFVIKEALNPTTIYVDKKSDLIPEKNKNELTFKLKVSKKQAIIGGGIGAFVFLLIVGSLIYCGCVKQKRR